MKDTVRSFPAVLIADRLGARCVSELEAAQPRPAADTGFVSDRFVVNPGALGYWLFVHFGLNVFADADCARIEVDPLAETVSILDRGDFRLPHWCYLPIGEDAFDPRPRSWPGLPETPVDQSSVREG